MKAGVCAVLVFCLWSPCGFARETPLTLFLAGQYSRAEAAGLAENDAQGFAIAARAVLADDMMRDKPCLECLRHAQELARHAIALDPKMPEGYIYQAAAVGFEARIVGNLEAQSRGMAGDIKRQLDAALADDPNNAWALAALGSWHIEIVRSAGPTLARWLFDARFATGQELYAKALAAEPNNLVLHFQHALALAGFDLSKYRQDVEDELDRTTAIAPASAYETFVKARTHDLLDALKRGDNAEVVRLVRRDQGYPA